MKKTALLVIDVQKGFDDPSLGKRNNPAAESNIARLLAAWREQKRPLIHIRHNSTEPNSPFRPELPGNAFKDEVRPLPGEKQFTKTVNSAFIGTGLVEYLGEQGIASLVIVGLTTDHCVSTSVRMAANLGFGMLNRRTLERKRFGYDNIKMEV
ncbi:MAG: cysteine hydrolase family protein [Anaerolineae bacterium]